MTRPETCNDAAVLQSERTAVIREALSIAAAEAAAAAPRAPAAEDTLTRPGQAASAAAAAAAVPCPLAATVRSAALAVAPDEEGPP